jgi:hypothetical protein
MNQPLKNTKKTKHIRAAWTSETITQATEIEVFLRFGR